LTHCELRWWFWSSIVAVLGLDVGGDVNPAAVVEFTPPPLQGGSVYGSRSEVLGFPYPCGLVSSDVHMLDRHVRILYEFMFYIYNGRMARVRHGLSMVSLEPSMLYPSTPRGRSPLKQPHGHFRSGHSQDGRGAAVFYDFGYPTPYASDHIRSKPKYSAILLNCPFFIFYISIFICKSDFFLLNLSTLAQTV
jgi:hypothetical protein